MNCWKNFSKYLIDSWLYINNVIYMSLRYKAKHLNNVRIIKPVCGTECSCKYYLRGSLVLLFVVINKNKIINRMFGSISLASTQGFITHAQRAFRQMKPSYCISKWTYEPPHMVSNFIFIKLISLYKIHFWSPLHRIVKLFSETTSERGLSEQP